MPFKTIPNATLNDVEAAIIEHYGRAHTREVAQSAGEKTWRFRFTGRQLGVCKARAMPGGVTITISSYDPPWLYVLLAFMIAVGLLMFILPGLVFLAFGIVRYLILSATVKSQFPKLVDTLQRVVATKRVSRTMPPVLPPSLNVPPLIPK